MVADSGVSYRAARPSDAKAIALLHADSWRRNYRGAYSDFFLDGDVVADRLAVWADRMEQPDPDHCTIICESEGRLIGFSHVIFADDPIWGALLDNLHVTHGLKRRGIGTQLMKATAKAVMERRPSTGLYLWVLEQNNAAQAFYDARGGVCVERGTAGAPGGDPTRLIGTPAKLRYAWSDPSILL